MKKIYVLVLTAICIALMTCKKDIEPYSFESEIKVSEITNHKALIEAKSEEAGFDKLDVLVEYSDKEDLSNTKQVEMQWQNDCFKTELSGLLSATEYYFRVVFTGKYNSKETETRSFKTLEPILKVTTSNITNIRTNSATSGGNVTDDGGATITARGVCWSTRQNPTISNSHTTDDTGIGSFTSNISDLAPNTQYYVRAYATNENGTSYGEEKSFTTLESNYNGYDWVDLGLPSGLKWATCNVGATSPEDYGDYFAWGETSRKSAYTESNSLTYGLSISQLQSQGYIDGSGNLTSSHDAATANWGGSWRMPTEDEILELKDECIWECTTQNGFDGRKVTGPNGNSIFLPAAGYGSGSSLNYAGVRGYYWSSTPYRGSANDAYDLVLGSGIHYVNWFDRNYGLPVRPVSE